MTPQQFPPDLARQVVTVSRSLAAARRAIGASTRQGRLVAATRHRADEIDRANFDLLRAYAEAEARNSTTADVEARIDTALALLDRLTQNRTSNDHDTDPHAAARTIYGA